MNLNGINIHYELAIAGILFLILLCYHRQKHLQMLRNKVFSQLIVMVFVTTILDVLSGLTLSENVPLWASHLSQSAFLSAHLITFYLHACYMLSWEECLEIIFCKKKYIYHIYLPCLIGIAFCITSPWTKLIFWIDNNRNAYFGRWYIIIHLIVTLYLLGPLVYMVTCRIRSQGGEKQLRRLILFLVSAVGIIGSSIMQYIMRSQTLIVYVMVSMVVLLYFLFLQEADYYMDETTGFFKMHGFEEVLKERVTNSASSSFLVFRIRNYSGMNEMYDYDRLSHVQKNIGEVMREILRKGDFYHISASSFALICDSPEQSREFYKALQEKLPMTWLVDGEELIHEYSFYVADTPTDYDDAKDLLRQINYARSEHVEHHKAGSLVHLVSKNTKEEQEKRKVADLVEQAIQDNSIEIYFQPVYSMEKQKITSLEVLSRLKDEQKKYINPEFFIHVAEEERTIIPLGEQIYQKACQFASQNDLFNRGIENININLSPVQCCYEGLADDLVRIAGENNVPMSRIHLEITESVLNNVDEITGTLERLNEVGAEIAMDDFGTGYANLSTMLRFPIQYVKIDKSLVWSYSEGKNQFLTQLFPMIQLEGKKIIAEGIETEEHIRLLQALHVDYLQGYFFSKPLPGDQFIRYLEQMQMVKK